MTCWNQKVSVQNKRYASALTRTKKEQIKWYCKRKFFNTHLRLSLTVPCSLVMPTGIVRAHFVCQRLPDLVAKKNQSERRFSLDTGNRWASEWVKCCYWGAHTIYWIADPASQTSTAQQRQQLLSALTWGYSQSTPSPKRLLLGFRSSSPCTSVLSTKFLNEV